MLSVHVYRLQGRRLARQTALRAASSRNGSRSAGTRCCWGPRRWGHRPAGFVVNHLVVIFRHRVTSLPESSCKTPLKYQCWDSRFSCDLAIETCVSLYKLSVCDFDMLVFIAVCTQFLIIRIQTRGQSNLTKSASRGAHSPVRGHPRGSKVVPLNSWDRVSY